MSQSSVRGGTLAGNRAAASFQVYTDENQTPLSSIPCPKNEWQEAPSSHANRENQQKPGTWSSAKVVCALVGWHMRMLFLYS